MGAYVESNLVKDERVVHETRLHWIAFFTWRGLFTLFLAPLIATLTSEFAITDKRIIIKVGFLSRRTLELNLSKVESVNVDQSILGRILGYGSIVVIGTGGTRELFGDIRDPLEFRKQFQQIST
jgi:uncharacterized membrane protein YdbT with pleckstrin-like domain